MGQLLPPLDAETPGGSSRGKSLPKREPDRSEVGAEFVHAAVQSLDLVAGEPDLGDGRVVHLTLTLHGRSALSDGGHFVRDELDLNRRSVGRVRVLFGSDLDLGGLFADEVNDCRSGGDHGNVALFALFLGLDDGAPVGVVIGRRQVHRVGHDEVTKLDI